MKKFFDVKWGRRAFLLLVYDMISVNLASLIALLIRYDFVYSKIPVVYLKNLLIYWPLNTVLTIVIFYFSRMYHSLWRFASINELWNITWGSIIAMIVQTIGMSILGMHMPISYYPLTGFIMYIAVILARFSYRLLRFLKNERGVFQRNDNGQRKNALIIGGGSAGKTIVDEIHDSTHVDFDIKCIIDDARSKQGRYIGGVPIVGGRDAIMKSVEQFNIDIIIVALPTAAPSEIRKILHICKNTNCELRMLPGVYQLVNGEVSVSKLRKVEITDLLGRDQIQVNINEIMGYVTDKVVLVTGGGGSIGSELCRQVALHKPKQLIIFDIYENNAYDIQQELVRKHPELNLVVLIGSVRNTHRINSVFEKYKPDIVYHAAAHKHVPLMEDSPNEAIKNNVFGTYKTAMAAINNGTKRFVLISTDKAVNPTNIMGASKRLCEMVVQMCDRMSDTEFVAVRFGNVLGSNGSVIPLFKKQIAEGGPVTVTHKDIIRYFMTIPEAVSLVLQAGAYAKGGEIFILDMGEPVRIDDLARNLIKLSGYVPDQDIKIKYTGLRPGEKLYEEMLMAEEGMKETSNKLIHIGKPIDMDYDEFRKRLDELKSVCEKDDYSVKKVVSNIVTTYKVQ